jgi:hypothetical protein
MKFQQHHEPITIAIKPKVINGRSHDDLPSVPQLFSL